MEMHDSCLAVVRFRKRTGLVLLLFVHLMIFYMRHYMCSEKYNLNIILDLLYRTVKEK